jgi:aminoglycoside phosphotransferase (APT) family kinase protein
MLDTPADPADAVALLERLSPGTDPPSAVLLDRASTRDLAIWNVRAGHQALRLKVATCPKWSARLRIGAAVATAAARAQVPAPDVVRVEEGETVPGLTVVLETRLGATTAATAYPRLTRPDRMALADATAAALARLHAIPPEPRLLHRAPPPSDGWRHGVAHAIERSLARLREDDLLPQNLATRVAARLRRGAERIPPGIPISLCHGSLRLASLALERKTFAGIVDFEHARAVDPLVDLVHLSLSTGEEDHAFARRLRSAYLAANPAVALCGAVDDRASTYAGLDILQALRSERVAESPEAQALLVDLLEAWLDRDAWNLTE